MALRIARLTALSALGLLAAACSSKSISTPARTATEQLLISTAVDKAAEKIAKSLQVEGKVFVDAAYFEGYDSKYAVATIRDSLLRHGAALAESRETAQTIVEIRTGALSIDTESSLLGLPEISLPIPFADMASTPEIALFKQDTTEGVAKFAATAYDRETGKMVSSTGPQYGFSHKADWILMLLVTWNSTDALPEGVEPKPEPWEPWDTWELWE
ncbi:hypothetical protein FDP22_21530 (plasmid) [Paroceanicella profunda]|uniref:Uncharacterized protein n=1 Tax=Paroceanicella profunda TaxID=2579971 RepID=A0A5B8G567_9RHOB|nr:DUF6655 family protein [Paroceanicella profunda]QDL94452.1 hypothetical protein FDP22_21530 [Paroceanicella profunda]